MCGIRSTRSYSGTPLIIAPYGIMPESCEGLRFPARIFGDHRSYLIRTQKWILDRDVDYRCDILGDLGDLCNDTQRLETIERGHPDG